LQAGRRFVRSRGGLIDAALRGQASFVEPPLTRELLLGGPQRRARLGDVRLGTLALLRPAARSDEIEPRLGDRDARFRRTQRFAVRLVVELREQRAGVDAVALLVVHLDEPSADAKAQGDLADIDVAVERREPPVGALVSLPPE